MIMQAFYGNLYTGDRVCICNDPELPLPQTLEKYRLKDGVVVDRVNTHSNPISTWRICLYEEPRETVEVPITYLYKYNKKELAEFKNEKRKLCTTD
jgi:hypothetical protein